MANVVVDGVSITDIAFAMRMLHGVSWSYGKTFLLGLAPQFLGFSVAGSIRQFLVWPSSMIWPGILVRCALLNTMHSNHGKKETKHISRERFLYLTGLCSFVWYWVPGYLWTGLSVFNWVCWIAPNNIVVNSLFGTISGLGMGLVTFDWTQIAFLGSPLVVPVCLVDTFRRNTPYLPPNVVVVGAAQHVGRVRVSHLVPLSDSVGYVHFLSTLLDAC